MNQYHLEEVTSPQQREKALMTALFNSGNDSINIMVSGFDLFASESTIRSDLYRIRETLPRWNLNLVIADGKATLTGKEQGKRSFYFTGIQRMANDSFFRDDALPALFPNIDIPSFSNRIAEIIRDARISVNESALFMLTLQILTAVKRISCNHELKEEEQASYPRFVRKRDRDCAASIAEYVKNSYQINMNETEIATLAVTLATHNDVIDAAKVSLDNLREYLWPSLYTMFTEVLDYLKDVYHINLRKNPANCVSLAFHLRALIHRRTVNLSVDNPYTESIKNLYPLSFEAAVFIARKIHSYFQIMVSEDEITFLTIYIANNMMANQNERSKITVLFVIPNYNIIFSELYDYYCRTFSYDIKPSLVSHIKEYRGEKPDLIITTDNPSEIRLTVETVQISPFVNETDIDNISRIVKALKTARKQDFRKRTLSSLIDGDLVRFGCNCSSLYELFTELLKPLPSKVMVRDDFVNDVLLRASLSSVVINGIAILRPSTFNAAGNTLSYLSLNHSVALFGEKIDAVFLLTFNESNFIPYINTLEYLVSFLKDKRNSREILKCSSYEELLDTLLNN